jgi:hypothetical protein
MKLFSYILFIYAAMIVNGQTAFAQKNNDKKGFLTADGPSFHLFTSNDITIDLKAIDPDKGYFGIDYKLDFIRSIATLNSKTFPYKNLNLGFSSNGFVTVVNEKNDVNSIINELKLEAFPLIIKSPAERVNGGDWRTAIEDTAEDVQVDPVVINSRRLARQFSSPFWLFLNFHGKHETTQDFKNYNFAIGSEISFTTSFLNAILDLPFSLLRTSPNNNPRQLDLSIGYDYVTGINKTQLASLKDSSDFMNRLNLKAEWETGVFTENDRLIILFDAYNDLDATKELKDANKDWNTFFMIKLEHILGLNAKTKTLTKIAIKYTNGELPPNFIKGYVLGAGFSVEF